MNFSAGSNNFYTYRPKTQNTLQLVASVSLFSFFFLFLFFLLFVKKFLYNREK